MEKFLTRYSDIVLAALVVSIIGMMIVPLPTFALDMLLTLNITLAVTLLMVSLYIPSALKISAFPSLLLITTLFRLALNVSSTRLILLQADAGEVIASFGEFVVQGNYVVGGVIFLIITLIQFIVIAKGSERVSEVSARFTLDAMPGKQMSIDADLRAGAFDIDVAREKRARLQKESKLYGAMDGAMKFVKGDAIAGLIITAINIVAGIIVGVAMKGMPATDAAQTYTLLTIGDGLVSQIPALLISTTAGIIVTRVSSEEDDEHLGEDIFGQLIAQPKAIAIAAGLLVILAIIPGLPTIPFLTMGAGVGFVAFALFKSPVAGEEGWEGEDAETVEEVEREAQQGARQARAMFAAVTPVTLDLGTELTARIQEADREEWLREMVPSMREGIFYDLGVKVPGVRVRMASRNCAAPGFSISIEEVPVDQGSVPAASILVNQSPSNLQAFDVSGEPTTHPVSGRPASWVPARHHAMLEEAGYRVWDAAGYTILRLTAALQNNAAEFVKMQEIQQTLDQLEGPYPALVQEVVPNLISLPDLTEVLRRLAEEGISVRNMPRILETLADRAEVIDDPLVLAEEVRTGLSRYITHKYAGADGSLVVYVLGREIEDTVGGSVRRTETGHYLALPPDMSQDILDATRRALDGDLDRGNIPIVLTKQEIRRYVSKLITMEVPTAVVLSYEELDPALNIQPIGKIQIGRR
jgi:type III secretion protein V